MGFRQRESEAELRRTEGAREDTRHVPSPPASRTEKQIKKHIDWEPNEIRRSIEKKFIVAFTATSDTGRQRSHK